MIGTTPSIKGTLQTEGSLTGKLTPRESLKASLSLPVERQMPVYQGDYEITPSQQTQVLNTAGLKTISDIVINPIPSNYGLVTWDGSVLTVS